MQISPNATILAVERGKYAAPVSTYRIGELMMSRDDVGRHNANDKLLGVQFLADAIPFRDKMLMRSGHPSFELLQKAVIPNVPIVAAVGAPSSLAVQAPRKFDITLVDFLRDQRFNIHHGIERIHKCSSSQGETS
jgi:FdhD protein